jgi:tRNA A-37 threonylcarbamoyl transferase component Bud32
MPPLDIHNGQVPTHDYEEELESLLAKLPEELATMWRERTDVMEDRKAAVALVQNILVERNKAKEKIFTRIHDIENPKIQEEIRAVLGSIENTFGDMDQYLGEGTVGKVYSMPYAPHVCVKYITDSNMLEKHGNTMRQEVEYLIELQKFNVEGIRVPDFYFQHMSENMLCFGMETIKGLSLDKIIADPEGCDFLDTIRAQDMYDIIRKMNAFLSVLHSDKKIVHRDLATRNIMIDTNGDWYVIDFGKAKRIELGDSTTDLSEKSDFVSAESSIRKLFLSIS